MHLPARLMALSLMLFGVAIIAVSLKLIYRYSGTISWSESGGTKSIAGRAGIVIGDAGNRDGAGNAKTTTWNSVTTSGRHMTRRLVQSIRHLLSRKRFKIGTIIVAVCVLLAIIISIVLFVQFTRLLKQAKAAMAASFEPTKYMWYRIQAVIGIGVVASIIVVLCIVSGRSCAEYVDEDEEMVDLRLLRETTIDDTKDDPPRLCVPHEINPKQLLFLEIDIEGNEGVLKTSTNMSLERLQVLLFPEKELTAEDEAIVLSAVKTVLRGEDLKATAQLSGIPSFAVLMVGFEKSSPSGLCKADIVIKGRSLFVRHRSFSDRYLGTYQSVGEVFHEKHTIARGDYFEVVPIEYIDAPSDSDSDADCDGDGEGEGEGEGEEEADYPLFRCVYE